MPIKKLCLAWLLLCCFNDVWSQENTVSIKPKKLASSKKKYIFWDQQSLTKISRETSRYTGYARLVELNDGKLLCVYESDGQIMIAFSIDKGTSWSDGEIAATRKSGINMAVPDILKLRDGSLLLMYNARPRPINRTNRFGIYVKRSADNGMSWSDETVLYEAGHEFENGCWEPAAIQLPNGQVQLYFANEGPYTQSNEQNISMLRSNDGGLSWNKEPEKISFRPGYRDGMPVPLLLKDTREIVVAIEDNGSGNFKPYLIRNKLHQHWKHTVEAHSKNRQNALATPLADSVYAGAPYLARLSTGETLLSYQGTDFRQKNTMSNANMKVLLGGRNASNFGSLSIPFLIPEGRSALWNSISVIKNDVIIALTSTNAFNEKGRVEVWMIKGYLR